jgi:hypothetical protein
VAVKHLIFNGQILNIRKDLIDRTIWYRTDPHQEEPFSKIELPQLDAPIINVVELVKFLNEQIPDGINLIFEYNQQIDRLEAQITGVQFLIASPYLAAFLGFERNEFLPYVFPNERQTFRATSKVDYLCGRNVFKIIADFVAPQIVSFNYQNLLTFDALDDLNRDVTLNLQYDTSNSYIPVQKSYLSEIVLIFTDSFDQPLQFANLDRRPLFVRLHFRRAVPIFG